MIFGGSTYGSAAYGGQEFGTTAAQTTMSVSATSTAQYEFLYRIVQTEQAWQEYTQNVTIGRPGFVNSSATVSSNYITLPWQIVGSVSNQSSPQLEYNRALLKSSNHQTQSTGYALETVVVNVQSLAALSQADAHTLEFLTSALATRSVFLGSLLTLASSGSAVVDQGSSFRIILGMLLSAVFSSPTFLIDRALAQPSILLSSASTG